MAMQRLLTKILNYAATETLRFIIITGAVAVLFYFLSVPVLSLVLQRDYEIHYLLTGFNFCGTKWAFPQNSKFGEPCHYTLKVGNTGTLVQRNVLIRVSDTKNDAYLLCEARALEIRATASRKSPDASFVDKHIGNDYLLFEVREFPPNTLVHIEFSYSQKCNEYINPKVRIEGRGVVRGDPQSTELARLFHGFLDWVL